MRCYRRVLRISYYDNINNEACAIRYMKSPVLTKISDQLRRNGKYDGLDVWKGKQNEDGGITVNNVQD